MGLGFFDPELLLSYRLTDSTVVCKTFVTSYVLSENRIDGRTYLCKEQQFIATW